MAILVILVLVPADDVAVGVQRHAGIGRAGKAEIGRVGDQRDRPGTLEIPQRRAQLGVW